MRKLFNEFFFISKHEKIREKVILTRLVVTITIIIVCLAAMSFSAYSYFSYNITSKSNVIKAANFETKISIQAIDKDGNILKTITPVTSNYKTYKTSELEPGEYYNIIITPTERNTAKTGFITVSARGLNETYHTQQVGIDENVSGGETSSLSFKLMITEKTEVFFYNNWGTSSYYATSKNKTNNSDLYITQNEKIKLVIAASSDSTADSTENNTDNNAAENTTTQDNLETNSTGNSPSSEEASPPSSTNEDTSASDVTNVTQSTPAETTDQTTASNSAAPTEETQTTDENSDLSANERN